MQPLAIGMFNQLKIVRHTAIGAYLATDEGEILLPSKYRPLDARTGDMITVFVYHDSEDRLVATTLTPKATVGDFALLEVTDTGQFGAFLNWGLEKDLLVPFSEQTQRMQKGERHVVRVYQDKSGRIAASARLGKFLEERNLTLGEGEQVDLLIYAFTELGAKVIINNRYSGLLFRDEIIGKRLVGERRTGFVKQIRPDGKINVTLKRAGDHELTEAKETILKTLVSRGGFLPLTDKSAPEQIAILLRMSKKTFKKAVGGLYKEGIIDLGADGLTLRHQAETPAES